MKTRIVFMLLLAVVSCRAALDDGLVAWYPFDGNSSDCSSNRFHGMPINVTPAPDRFGTANSALYFSGTRESLSDAEASFVWCGDAIHVPRITVSLWFKADPSCSASLIGGTSQGFIIGMLPCTPSNSADSATASIVMAVATTNDTNLNARGWISMCRPIDIREWHNAALTYDGSNMCAFIDGNRLFSHSTTQEVAVFADKSEGIAIGRCSSEDLYCFKGSLDDVRIYNRALPALEIQQLHARSSAQPALDRPGNVQRLDARVVRSFAATYFPGISFENMQQFRTIVSNCVTLTQKMDDDNKDFMVAALCTLLQSAPVFPGYSHQHDAAVYCRTAVLSLRDRTKDSPVLQNQMNELARQLSNSLAFPYASLQYCKDIAGAQQVFSQELVRLGASRKFDDNDISQVAESYIECAMLQQRFSDILWVTGVVEKLAADPGRKRQMLDSLIEMSQWGAINTAPLCAVPALPSVPHATNTCSHSVVGEAARQKAPALVNVYPQMPHNGRIRHLSFSPCGKMLAAADDAKIVVWDIASGRQMAATNMVVDDLAFGKFNCFLMAARANTLCLLDPVTFTPRRPPISIARPITCFDTAKEADTIVLGDEAGTVTVITDNSTNSAVSTKYCDSPIIALTVSADANLACALDQFSGTATVWQLPNLTRFGHVAVARHHRQYTKQAGGGGHGFGVALAFSDDGAYLFAGVPDGFVTIISVAGLEPVRRIYAGVSHWADQLGCVSFSTPLFLAFTGRDALKMWDVRSCRLSSALFVDDPTAISVAQDGSMVAVGFDANDIRTGVCRAPLNLKSLSPPIMQQYASAFAGASSRVLSVDSEGYLNEWNLDSIGNGPRVVTGGWSTAAISSDARTYLAVTTNKPGGNEAWVLDSDTLSPRCTVRLAGPLLDRYSTFVSFIDDEHFTVCSPDSMGLYDVQGRVCASNVFAGEDCRYFSHQIAPSNDWIVARNSRGCDITAWDLTSLATRIVIPYKDMADCVEKCIGTTNVDVWPEQFCFGRNSDAIIISFGVHKRRMLYEAMPGNKLSTVLLEVKLKDGSVRSPTPFRTNRGWNRDLYCVGELSNDDVLLTNGAGTIHIATAADPVPRPIHDRQGIMKRLSTSFDDRWECRTESGGLEFRSGKEHSLIATAYKYTDGEWIVITPEGYYVCSPKGDKYLNVRVGNRVFGIDNYREAFNRPALVRKALAGESLEHYRRLEQIKLAPEVSIGDVPAVVSVDKASVAVTVEDIGGGIGDVRVYLNGTCVNQDTPTNSLAARGESGKVTKAITLHLVNGTNTIRVIAFNEEGTMHSAEVVREIFARFETFARPALYALVIGINEYENPRYNLLSCVPDAEMFGKALHAGGDRLFASVSVTMLTNKADTTRDAIVARLDAMTNACAAQDLFVFYIAAHGTVEDGGDRRHFVLPSNFTSKLRLADDAIDQDTLKRLLCRVPAGKKIVVLDVCQAEKLGDAVTVAMLDNKTRTRGAEDEDMVRILSKAVGSTVLAACTTSQQAAEGYKGHGIFSYVVAEGLGGKADLNMDGFIQTTELAEYVDRTVPIIAAGVTNAGQPMVQYPVANPCGMVFPVAMVKQGDIKQ